MPIGFTYGYRVNGNKSNPETPQKQKKAKRKKKSKTFGRNKR